MSIQWFPGHMHKARLQMKSIVAQVDVLIELTDARIPYSSENPMLNEMLGATPRLKMLTRADLADPAVSARWMSAYEATGERVMLVNLLEDIPSVTATLNALAGRTASTTRPLTALVAGIPNVGKSTLINRLAGRRIARTGNEPAITRHQQRVPLDNGWVLCDTPGILWPRVENPASGLRLAATGAIRDTAIDSSEIALGLIDYLREAYPKVLSERYAVSLPAADSQHALERIGRGRGCLIAGNQVDYDRSARLLISDFRNGMLGRLSLETPAMRDAEIAALAVRTAEREADREAARQRRKARRARRRRR